MIELEVLEPEGLKIILIHLQIIKGLNESRSHVNPGWEESEEDAKSE